MIASLLAATRRASRELRPPSGSTPLSYGLETFSPTARAPVATGLALLLWGAMMEARMARIAIEMPRLGYDMESGKVGAWVKKVGDKVSRGEVIAEIETEKSTVDMESTAAGTLVEIIAQAGAELPVGEIIGYLDDEA